MANLQTTYDMAMMLFMLNLSETDPTAQRMERAIIWKIDWKIALTLRNEFEQ